MGCDGGTIPRRDELVKTKKKPEHPDKDIKDNARWRYCALSQKELKKPIVACELGKLYNKDTLIEYLLDKEAVTETVAHIKNLKDVKTLNLKTNPAFSEKSKNESDYVNLTVSPFICPIVGIEMSGKYRFVVLWKCGCVMSERALKTIKTDLCMVCTSPFEASEIVVLNPDEKELELITKQMQERRLKSKKNKRKKAAETQTAKGDSDPDKEASTSNSAPKKIKLENGAAAKTQEKSNADQVTKTLLTGRANPDYSVADDPNASEAFKSLFTSHKNALSKPKQHWVTHNPCFY